MPTSDGQTQRRTVTRHMSSSKAVRIGLTLLAGCALVPAVAWLLDIAIGRMLVLVAIFALLPAAGGMLPRLPGAGWLLAVGGNIPMLLFGPVLWWMGVLGEIGFLRFAIGWGSSFWVPVFSKRGLSPSAGMHCE